MRGDVEVWGVNGGRQSATPCCPVASAAEESFQPKDLG